MLYRPWVYSANRVFNGVLLVQLLITFFIAFLTDDWFVPVLLSLLIVSLPLLLIRVAGQSKLTRHVIAAAVQLITAVHIDQTMGLVEMHFEIFVVMAFLIYYRDWTIVVTSVAVVAVHHILFFILQSSGADVYIFAEGYVTLGILAIHAGFAVAEAGVLCVIAKQSDTEAMSAQTLRNSIADIVKQPEQLNLMVDVSGETKEVEAFKNLLLQFQTNIQHTRSLSKQVQDVSSTLSRESSELIKSRQVSSQEVDSIASAIEQMAVTISSISEQANSAKVSAEESIDLSEQAAGVSVTAAHSINSLKNDVLAANEKLTSLNKQCHQISDVIGAINDITKQTNLLALNAAIEAARAGEEGRGFAVVADEVRSLAATTGKNAEQISQISQNILTEVAEAVNSMEACVQQIDEAVTYSEDSGVAMKTVAGRINDVTQKVISVAAATEEQRNASEDISRSAQTMRELSEAETHLLLNGQENGTTLKAVSTKLDSEVGRFIVD
ncbi:methyl-accepting chemotaxis protein [Idiomarina loihiensis]|uniref:methyl-accepting chemotaxis protein n=1 Tax=Idiomarina TaxID=135575 RepID=UPI000D71518B|nr:MULTISPECIES: methyl-accepting chemotaxis protein [Idiomarina]PWW39433.1 methyl-accepting chemotaxis protein [Idiomarina loihiensis]TDP49472.1 methyl-accepting chemotaxis protein [Idiomarina loihiensis]TDS24214.1 methyl-accepting chemotaxis protein [Idiomarina sp. H2]